MTPNIEFIAVMGLVLGGWIWGCFSGYQICKDLKKEKKTGTMNGASC